MTRAPFVQSAVMTLITACHAAVAASVLCTDYVYRVAMQSSRPTQSKALSTLATIVADLVAGFGDSR